MSENAEYSNTWSVPRLGFLTPLLYPDIGGFVGASSYALGLNLKGFDDTKTWLRSTGAFRVEGPYEDVRAFAKGFQAEFDRYLNKDNIIDWDFYDSVILDNQTTTDDQ